MVHATKNEFYKKIFQDGLLPGGGEKSYRQQVHLLEDRTSASKFFPRRTDIVLHVAPSAARDCTFSNRTMVTFKPDNGYFFFLTEDPIPAKHIIGVTVRETEERVESEKDSPPLPSRVLQAYLRPSSSPGRP